MKNENLEKYIGELSPEMQEKARAVLDLVEARDTELNQRIWGELK